MLRRYSLLSTFFAGMAAVFFSFAASLAQEASPDAGQLLKWVRQGATLQENKDKYANAASKFPFP